MDNRIYQMSPAPEKLEGTDLNAYILRGKAENDDKWFSVFLHFYEPIINQKVESFLRRFQIGNDHFDDLKQEFSIALWNCYETYDPASGVDFLAVANGKTTDALHEYVASVGLTKIEYSEDQYRVFRKVARLYFEKTADGISFDAAISEIAAEESMHKNNVKQYVDTALSWKNDISFEDFLVGHEEDEEDNLPPELIVGNTYESDVPEDLPLEKAEWLKLLRKVLSEAVNRLDDTDQKFLSMVEGISFPDWSSFEPNPLNEVALVFSFADASGVIKNRRRIYDLLTRELCDLQFLDAVKIRKIKPPKDYSNDKALRYYRYQPMCDGKEGLIVTDVTAPSFFTGFRVLIPAETDTILTHRYAMKLVRKMDMLTSLGKNLPEDRTFVWFFHKESDEATRRKILRRKLFVYVNRFVEYRFDGITKAKGFHLLNFTYRPEHSGEWGWITVEPNEKRPFLSRVAYPQLADEDLTYSTPYAKAVERIVKRNLRNVDYDDEEELKEQLSGEVRFVDRGRI